MLDAIQKYCFLLPTMSIEYIIQVMTSYSTSYIPRTGHAKNYDCFVVCHVTCSKHIQESPKQGHPTRRWIWQNLVLHLEYTSQWWLPRPVLHSNTQLQTKLLEIDCWLLTTNCPQNTRQNMLHICFSKQLNSQSNIPLVFEHWQTVLRDIVALLYLGRLYLFLSEHLTPGKNEILPCNNKKYVTSCFS